MNFNVGDIIFQNRDKITFLIVEKKRNKFILEYYDTGTMSVISVTISKNQLEAQFKDKPQYLEHFKVILK